MTVPDSEIPLDTLPRGMVEVLNVPRGKYDVPTLVTYTREGVPRHVIVEVGGPLVAEAWRLWCAERPADPEAFLLAVYRATRQDIPRMYRAVSHFTLGEVPADAPADTPAEPGTVQAVIDDAPADVPADIPAASPDEAEEVVVEAPAPRKGKGRSRQV